MFAQMMRYGGDGVGGRLDNGYFWGNHPLMMWAYNYPGATWVLGVLWIVTWVLVAIVLVALARWLWKKGDKSR